MQRWCLAFILLLPLEVAADATYERTTHVVTITHPVVIPEGGSIDEFLSLSATWAELVLKRNPKLIDVTYLLDSGEFDGGEVDTLDLLVLYEYASPEAAAEAGAIVQKLIGEAWNEEEQASFFDQLGSYVVREKKVTRHYQRIETYKATSAP